MKMNLSKLSNNRILIEDLKSHIKKKVEIKGFLHEIRNQSKIKFILMRDFTGIIQCVIEPDNKNAFVEVPKIPRESVIKICGEVKESKQAPGGIEILVEDYEVLSKSEETIPIPIVEKTSGETDLSKRLDYRCIDLRKPKNLAIFKIQSALLEGMKNWLDKNGYIQVFTPSLMGVASESGSEVFEVKYFDGKAYLRQDPQLHRQLTILGGIEKIYDIGPSWRAEKSHTVWHMTEHRTIAVELAFIKDEQEVMRVEEQVIIAAIKNVVEKCQQELESLGVKVRIPKAPFLEIKFPDIYDILKGKGKDLYGEDLDKESEKIIWKEHIQKKYPDSDFYFFNGFPHAIKPFYVMEGSEGNEEWAKSVDLNFKGIEMSSGGQREHRYEKLMKNVKSKDIPNKSVEWFTKFFKWGAPPHGGFSIGIERLTAVLLGLNNVREACLFPRDTERLVP